jgi:hypothetical protein
MCRGVTPPGPVELEIQFKVGTSARVDPEETEAEALYLTKLGKSK